MPDFYFRDESGRDRAAKLVANLPIDGEQYRIEWKKVSEKRRDRQNSLQWLWLGLIQKHMQEAYGIAASSEEWHETFCRKLMPMEACQPKTLPDGTIIEASRWRSSKSSVKEMTEYLNKLDQYCAEELQLLLPHPEDIYHEAMSKR